MSVEMMGNVWKMALPHTEKMILLAMADHADHLGRHIYPSFGLIAWKTDYSIRQVYRSVRTLEAQKILVKTRNRRGYANEYRIDLTHAPMKPIYRVKPEPEDKDEKDPCQDGIGLKSDPCQGGRGGMPTSQGGDDRVSSESSVNHQLIKKAPRAREKSAKTTAPEPPIPTPEEIAERRAMADALLDRTAKALDMTPVVSEGRRQELLAVKKQAGEDWVAKRMTDAEYKTILAEVEAQMKGEAQAQGLLPPEEP